MFNLNLREFRIKSNFEHNDRKSYQIINVTTQ